MGEGRCTQVHGGGQGTICLGRLPIQTTCGLVSSCHPGSVRMDLTLLSGYLGFCSQGKLVGKRWDVLTPKDRLSLVPNTNILTSSHSTTPNPVLGESRWPTDTLSGQMTLPHGFYSKSEDNGWPVSSLPLHNTTEWKSSDTARAFFIWGDQPILMTWCPGYTKSNTNSVIIYW